MGKRDWTKREIERVVVFQDYRDYFIKSATSSDDDKTYMQGRKMALALGYKHGIIIDNVLYVTLTSPWDIINKVM